MKTATLVELTVVDGITPLASGCLATYARSDALILAAWDVKLFDAPVERDRIEILEELASNQSDVYALSCYVWNMGTMRWLMENLATTRPDAHIILGGPQVMNHAADDLAPSMEHVAVCNGEGEQTFREYLRELTRDVPDLSRVPGLSFWRDGTLVTTDPPDRIRDLTDIPSPYTEQMFEPGRFTFGVLETNRGCPYNCAFCYWGAATNSRINKAETERVLDEITWMSEQGYFTLFLADANWGILKRDVEIARHITDCAKKNGYPMYVGLNSAKNKPDRVAEMTKILADGGVLTSHPISMQTMDAEVLELIDRSNIRSETYTELQTTLRDQGISSFIELIWPLPGESVETFKCGLTSLCRSGAETILVYPHILLRNTPMAARRSELGIEVRRVPDDAAEADIVVTTKWLNVDGYETGQWVYYAAQCLYNLRGLYYLGHHLDRSGRLPFGELFGRAAESFRRRADRSPFCKFLAESVAGLASYALVNSGEVAHRILYADRAEFDELLEEVVREHDLVDDDQAAAAFELDLLARPFIYRDDIEPPARAAEVVGVEQVGRREYELDVPDAVAALVADLHPTCARPKGPLQLAHVARRKRPYRKDESAAENIEYCQTMTLHMSELLPRWSRTAAGPRAS